MGLFSILQSILTDFGPICKEHERKTTIGEHMRTYRNNTLNLSNDFNNILKKRKNKWDCLMFKMLFIHNLKTNLNKEIQ